MLKLSIFNPDHEIALANDDKNFKPKKNIVRLAHDLSLLPLWYDDGCCTVVASATTRQWENLAYSLGLSYNKVESIDYSTVTEINLWGWNKAICKSLADNGLPNELIKTELQLADIRRLTERRTAIEAMAHINDLINSSLIPQPPIILTSMDEVLQFVDSSDDMAVLKSPLSESGKGVCFVSSNTMNHSVFGWANRTISQQGYMVAERFYDVRHNFAMEFAVSGTTVDFEGYSLFTTNGKSYEKNILMPDNAIEQLISNCVPIELIEDVRKVLVHFVANRISPYYQGYLGVDMFIYKNNDRYCLHPCVEINLRPTMGLIANRFYRRFVEQDKNGIFAVDFFASPSDLFADHTARQQAKPPRISGNRITEGYVSLCPIKADTQYRVRVEI